MNVWVLDRPSRRLGGVLIATILAAAMIPGLTVAQDATKHVSIVDKDMTDAEITAAIAAESYLTVGNWTYSANDVIQQEFQKYVKDTYGLDIQLIYEGTQQPSIYLTKLAASHKVDQPAPYDVVAVEESYWAEAMAKDLPDSFLPSDLIPNRSLVLD